MVWYNFPPKKVARIHRRLASGETRLDDHIRYYAHKILIQEYLCVKLAIKFGVLTNEHMNTKIYIEKGNEATYGTILMCFNETNAALEDLTRRLYSSLRHNRKYNRRAGPKKEVWYVQHCMKKIIGKVIELGACDYVDLSKLSTYNLLANTKRMDFDNTDDMVKFAQLIMARNATEVMKRLLFISCYSNYIIAWRLIEMGFKFDENDKFSLQGDELCCTKESNSIMFYQFMKELRHKITIHLSCGYHCCPLTLSAAARLGLPNLSISTENFEKVTEPIYAERHALESALNAVPNELVSICGDYIHLPVIDVRLPHPVFIFESGCWC